MSIRILILLVLVEYISADLSRVYSNISCSNHELCHETMGNRSNCISGMCQCIIRHHLSDKKNCIEDKGLHESCDTNEQCYWGPEMIDKIECKDGVCKCKTWYMEASGRICIRYFKNVSTTMIFTHTLLMTTLILIISK